MKNYLLIALSAFGLTAILTPLIHMLCIHFRLFDHPDKKLKDHAYPIPRLGGVAIFISIALVLIATRFLTHYPTGTIRHFRYILLALGIIFLLGVADDIKRDIIRYRGKFVIEFIAAGLLLLASIRIHFLSPEYFAVILTLVWVVGITNSINLIDIMDGLAASQVAIASAAFLAISFPSEDIYVNIFAAALLGATLGFLPFNLTKRFKMFMGDSGSLVLGFCLAALALGSSYTTKNNYAVFAPLLILGVPMFETFFLMWIRAKQGLSPFLGSHDHTAHRLQMLGFQTRHIVVTMGAITTALSVIAMIITRQPKGLTVLTIYVFLVILLLITGKFLGKLKTDKALQ